MATLRRLFRPALQQQHPAAFYIVVVIVVTALSGAIAGACLAGLEGGLTLRNTALGFTGLLGAIAVSSFTKLISTSSTRAPSRRIKMVMMFLSVSVLAGGALWAATTALTIARFEQTGWVLVLLAACGVAVTVGALAVALRHRSVLLHPAELDVDEG